MPMKRLEIIQQGKPNQAEHSKAKPSKDRPSPTNTSQYKCNKLNNKPRKQHLQLMHKDQHS